MCCPSSPCYPNSKREQYLNGAHEALTRLRFSGPAQFTATVGYGRGERSSVHAFQLIYVIAPTAGMLVEVV
jgi:hypothetical protein